MFQKLVLPSGDELSIETDAAGGGFRQNSALDNIDISKTLRRLAEFCDIAVTELQNLTRQPEQIELSIGVKIGVEGQIIIAKGTSEANLQVKLSFKRAEVG